MTKIVPDGAETEIEDFPLLDQRVLPPSADLRGLGHNHLAPPPEPVAPEIPPGAENIVAYDENPVDEGHRVETLLPDDEQEVPAQLTAEGLDEAERSLRKDARLNTPTSTHSADL